VGRDLGIALGLIVVAHYPSICAFPSHSHPWKAITVTFYRIQEADLDIPDTWQDQSINIFKLPAVGGAKEASFVISRDASQGDAIFADYVDKQVKSAEQQLPEFKLVQRWDTVLHAHAATLLDYTWKREGRELMLRQMFIERKPAVLITTLTTTPSDLVHHETAWKIAMSSLKPLVSGA
jgi:hypothetical protein